MADTLIEKCMDAEKQEEAPSKSKPRFTLIGFLKSQKEAFRKVTLIVGIVTLVYGAYYSYTILCPPDPWYIRALAIFGF